MIAEVIRKYGIGKYRQSLLLIMAIVPLVLADATISVDWSKVKRAVDPLSYGVNASYGYTASRTGNAAYRNGIKYAIGKPGGGTALLRLHRQGIVGTWSPGGTWNATTVVGGLKPLMDNGFEIMIDFDRAIGGGSNMDIQPKDAADLVRIVNVTNKLNVKYWEIYNENGGTGSARGAQVKACSKAMKAVDSTIKVGGTAMSYLDQNFYLQLVQAALPDIDFVSYHGYQGGGTSGTSDATLYDWAWGLGNGMRQLRTMLTTQSPNKYIPIIFDEYNLSWDWNVVDQRTTSNKGGVFSALVMATTIDNGADVSNRWNESEAAFAFMDNNGAPYTVAHVYHLFNQYCYGDQVTATTTDNKSIVGYAVQSSTRHTLVLINRAASQQTANVTFTGWSAPTAFTRYQVWTRNGIDSSSLSWTSGSNAVILPDNSVTFLTVAAGTPVEKPMIKQDITPVLLNGPVTVGLYSASGQLLSTFVTNGKGRVSVEAVMRSAHRALPRTFGNGAYFMTLTTNAQQLKAGPFVSRARY